MILVSVMGTVQYGHLEAKPPPEARPFTQSFVRSPHTRLRIHSYAFTPAGHLFACTMRARTETERARPREREKAGGKYKYAHAQKYNAGIGHRHRMLLQVSTYIDTVNLPR